MRIGSRYAKERYSEKKGGFQKNVRRETSLSGRMGKLDDGRQPGGWFGQKRSEEREREAKEEEGGREVLGKGERTLMERGGTELARAQRGQGERVSRYAQSGVACGPGRRRMTISTPALTLAS